jgi:DNA processing protein
VTVMLDDLTVAVAMFDLHRTPAKVARALGKGGSARAQELALMLSPEELNEAHRTAEGLALRDVGTCFLGDPNYPAGLAAMGHSPAILFTWGNQDLLNEPGIGMCGSRNVSERGLRAAQQCGTEVANHGLIIISGYARGVDTETHLAALGSGGRTAIVLAEGISHFRRKKAFSDVDFDPSRIVVLSQFPPGQAWNVGAAMSRNRVIVGLGKALVVVEAGETGGTLDAGRQAIKSGKAVLALEFSEGATPPGNRILHELGAIAIRSRQQLARLLDGVGAAPEIEEVDWQQLSLL